MKVHEFAQYYTLDTVAETMDGIGSDLYKKLWGLMTDVEVTEDGPLYETPGDALGQGPNILSDHWKEFTEEEQQELSSALDLT